MPMLSSRSPWAVRSPIASADRSPVPEVWRGFLAGLVHRVAPDKIVELVPALGRTLQQVRADQDIQRPSWRYLPGKDDRSGLTEVGAWMQREQPEYPGRRFWESLVG